MPSREHALFKLDLDMTKEQLIRAIVAMKDYRFTHDELMRMTKKQLLEYYPHLRP